MEKALIVEFGKDGPRRWGIGRLCENKAAGGGGLGRGVKLICVITVEPDSLL